LSDKDRKERKAFADAHEKRTSAQWQRSPHAIIDNKVFQVYTHGKARDYAARRAVRAAYRRRSTKVSSKGYAKPPKSLKYNTNVASVMITCAIGNGKVLMWHEVKGNWNGRAGAEMYSGPLQTALKRAYPSRRGAFKVMEDNDPVGYKSKKGLDAKEAAGIEAFSLPKRSPDLNPLDFSFWAEVNRRMRKQEASWPSAKKEKRDVFLRRLRRTAKNISPEFINKIIGNLPRRLQLLKGAKGGHFPEGGC
jgi:hypothetical protein